MGRGTERTHRFPRRSPMTKNRTHAWLGSLALTLGGMGVPPRLVQPAEPSPMATGSDPVQASGNPEPSPPRDVAIVRSPGGVELWALAGHGVSVLPLRPGAGIERTVSGIAADATELWARSLELFGTSTTLLATRSPGRPWAELYLVEDGAARAHRLAPS